MTTGLYLTISSIIYLLILVGAFYILYVGDFIILTGILITISSLCFGMIIEKFITSKILVDKHV